MAGFTGLTSYFGEFYNSSGEFVGTKRIQTSFLGISKKTFEFQKGTYIVESKKSRSSFTPFPFIMDYCFYKYILNDPEPVSIERDEKPKFKSQDFRKILKSDVLAKLNKVRFKLFDIDFRTVVIILIVLGVGLWFLTGNDFSDLGNMFNAVTEPITENPEVVPEAVRESF